MFSVVITAATLPWWVPVPVDPPGLVARIGTPAYRLPALSSWLGVSPDGRWLYAANDVGGFHHGILERVSVMDAGTGKIAYTYPIAGEHELVVFYAIERDGLRVLVRYFSGDDTVYQVRLLGRETGEPVRVGKPWPFAGRGPAVPIALPRGFEGRSYGTFWTEAETVLLDTETGKAVPFNPPVPDAEAFRVDPENRIAAVQLKDTTIRVYDLPGGTLRATISKPGEKVELGDVTPDGKRVAVWVQVRGNWVRRTPAWSIELWDADGAGRQRLLSDLPHGGSVVLSPDGKTFAYHPGHEIGRSKVGGWEVWDLTTGQKRSQLPSDYSTRGVSFGSNGTVLWQRAGDVLTPYHAATGRLLENAPNPPGPVEAMRFTPEGKLVGTAGGFVIEWDSLTGKELRRVQFSESIDWTNGVTLSPAADHLLFTDREGRIVAWGIW